MKLDGEHVLCHGAVGHKSDSKPIGPDNAAIDSIERKPENGLENKDQNGNFCDLKSREGKAERLQYAIKDEDCWTTPYLDLSMQMDDSTREDEKLRDFVAPVPLPRSSLETESLEKDSVFYLDKSVTEPELPELVVCYKENTYHVVKDICIDEGFPSKDKFLFDTDVDEKNLCTFLEEADTNSEVSPEEEIFSLGELHSIQMMVEELSRPKSSDNSEDEAKEHSQKPCESAIFEKSCACDEYENGNGQAFVASSMTASLDEETNCCHEAAISKTQSPDCGAKASDHDHDQNVLSSPATEESENDSKEGTLESHTAAESDSTSKIEDESCNSKVEPNNITFDLNSSAASTSRGDEGSQTGDCEHPETRNLSGPEDVGAESFSSQLQFHNGESSFSATGPVSGLISYSGPIAYSGSLSLRSDSSTTSTRSFAFPILQTEWNSSPVKMAKAERRHLRKHSSWRRCLLCCRF